MGPSPWGVAGCLCGHWDLFIEFRVTKEGGPVNAQRQPGSWEITELEIRGGDKGRGHVRGRHLGDTQEKAAQQHSVQKSV